MRTSALFGAKKLRNFRSLCCGRTDKMSSASADILRTKEEGVNFSRFCADVLYGQPQSISFSYLQQLRKHFALYYLFRTGKSSLNAFVIFAEKEILARRN